MLKCEDWPEWHCIKHFDKADTADPSRPQPAKWSLMQHHSGLAPVFTNNSISKVDLLGLCEEGDKRNCELQSYYTQSEETNAILNAWIESEYALNEAVENMGIRDTMIALATRNWVALGGSFVDPMGEMLGDTLRATFIALRQSEWTKDNNREVYIYVAIEYEECVCGFLGIGTTWEDKTRETTHGPFQNALVVNNADIDNAVDEAKSFCDE
jgi:hypothetical protein